MVKLWVDSEMIDAHKVLWTGLEKLEVLWQTLVTMTAIF
jgi:hypothetical protein